MCLQDISLLIAITLFGICAVRQWESVAGIQLLLVLVASIFIYTSVRNSEIFSFTNFLWVLIAGAALQSIYAWLLFLGAFTFMDLRSTVLFGGFLQPNLLASFLATALAAVGVLLEDTEQKCVLNKRLSLYGPLFLIFVTLLSIGSRTGWIAMTLVAVLTFFWLGAKSRCAYINVFVMSLLTTLALQLVIPELNTRLTNKATMATPRYEMWDVTLSMIMEQPIFGYGLEAFNREYTETVASIIAQGGDANPFPGLDHPHNFVLNWWFIGGLGTVIAFFIVAAWHLWALSKISPQKRLFFLALMTPIYLHMQTEFPFRLSPVHLLLVVCIMAFLSTTAFQQTKKLQITSVVSKSLGTSVYTLIAIAGVFLLLESSNSWHIFRATKLPEQYATDLQKVVLPTASLERYDDAIAIVSMQRARASGNLTYYYHFADWAEQKIVKTPRPEIYEALIEAHKALGNHISAQRFFEEMVHLFPNTKTRFK